MIELKDVCFRWSRKDPLILDIPRFQLRKGERVFLEGPSGSGKTTLLNILGGVVLPQTGTVKVNGTDLTQLNSANRDAFRANYIGIIFQMFNLIPYLSPIENIVLPCHFSANRRTVAKNKSKSVEEEARRLLTKLQVQKVTGKNSHAANFPSMALSVGEQQRVAAARALIGGPHLVIADEPTSALDYEAQHDFMKLLFDEVSDAGATLLFVSHEGTLANEFDRKIKLSDVNHAVQR